MDLDNLLALITETDTYNGYANTGAKLPYVVARPLSLNPDELSLDGSAVIWNNQVTLYCCAGSVQASSNLARAVLRRVHGARIGDDVLSASVGYFGAPVDGHYEAQITVQVNQGGL